MERAVPLTHMAPTHPRSMQPPVTPSIKCGCSDSAPLTNWAMSDAMRPEPERTPKAVARTPCGKLSVESASSEFHPEVVRLIWTREKAAVLFTLGTRLVYTVASVTYFPDPVNALWLCVMMLGSLTIVFHDASMVSQMLQEGQ